MFRFSKSWILYKAKLVVNTRYLQLDLFADEPESLSFDGALKQCCDDLALEQYKDDERWQ